MPAREENSCCGVQDFRPQPSRIGLTQTIRKDSHVIVLDRNAITIAFGTEPSRERKAISYTDVWISAALQLNGIAIAFLYRKA
jgi:hypothetical protein